MSWRRHWRAVGSALGMVLVAPAACSQAQPATPPPVIAGELIVYFTPDSAESDIVLRAAAQPTPDTGSVQVLAQRLGKAVGTTLQVDRLGSGGMVIMTIDAAAVRARVAEALVAPDAFPGAAIESRASGSGAGSDLLVRPAGTLPAAVDVAGRIERAGEAARVPLRGDPRDGAVAVGIDWNRLTRSVAEAVRHQPAVRDVELNAVMFPYAAGAD